VEENEIDRLLRELGLEVPEVPDEDLNDLTLPRWSDDDLEGWDG
jgi:hypothetical protein